MIKKKKVLQGLLVYKTLRKLNIIKNINSQSAQNEDHKMQ